MRKIIKIHIHHTETPTKWFTGHNHDKLMDDIRDWHLDRGFIDIGYHHVIFPDGIVLPGRLEIIKPASIKWHNVGALAICVWGNFDIEKINDIQYDSLLNFTVIKLEQYKLNVNQDIIFHREYNKQKNCPGKSIIKSEFIENLRQKQLLNKV